jgi:hypothetical protein
VRRDMATLLAFVRDNRVKSISRCCSDAPGVVDVGRVVVPRELAGGVSLHRHGSWRRRAIHLAQYAHSLDPAVGAAGDPIPLTDTPLTMLYAANSLWIMLPQSRVQSLNVQTGAVSQPLSFHVCPECFPSSALGFDGVYVWAGAGDDSARAIDPATGQAVASRAMGWLSFGVMVFDGVRVWSAPPSFDGVAGFDTRAHQMIDLPLTIGAQPSALAFDGDRLWVASAGDHTLRAIDVETGAVGEPIAIQHPAALVFDGQRLWWADQESGVVQYLVVQP